jgi:PTH1 family peptidyl-tRNA hydrolase
LGNPEPRYARTPHNLGFLVLDELGRRWGVQRRRDRRVLAEVAEHRRGDRRLWLMAPLTYMNNSGEAARPFCSYYDIPAQNVLVICDDHDLSWGRLRLRPGGSSAGHKGLESIRGQLGTDQFPRLRLGIRPSRPQRDLVEYVLSPFWGEAVDLVEPVVATAADAVEAALDCGLDQAMNRFNGVDLAASGEG